MQRYMMDVLTVFGCSCVVHDTCDEGDWVRHEEAQAEIDTLKQSLKAKLADHINGTPCAAIRWQYEKEDLQAEIARRVIAAEKLVEAVTSALNCMDGGLDGLAYDELSTALAAYREASK